MKILRVPIKGKKLELIGLGDIHLGHRNVDWNALENVIEYIRTHNCRWIGGGDYGDAIIAKDKRFDFRSLDIRYATPQKQYKKIYQLFYPIRKKCIGLIEGNHDIIHWKKHSHSYVEELAEDLEVSYLQMSSYIRLHFEDLDADFNIYVHHGWTGARTKGGKISRIYDLGHIFPMIDLYMMFHIHDLGLADKMANLFVDETLEIRDRIASYVFGGSFLKGYVKDQTSYVEERTYRPSILGSPVITIIPKKGKATTSFDIREKDIR